MGIHEAVSETIYKHEMKCGEKPTCLYMGDQEITALLALAHEEGYISDPENTPIEGDNRPEVQGLPVYVVNTNSHLACS